MIIYQIKLPKKQDSDAFVRFMRQEYFPAIHKVGATRVGQVINLVLLQRENEIEGDDVGNEFAWLRRLEWSTHRRGSRTRASSKSGRFFTADFWGLINY